MARSPDAGGKFDGEEPAASSGSLSRRGGNVGQFDGDESASQSGSALHVTPAQVMSSGKQYFFVQSAQGLEDGSRQSKMHLLSPHEPRFTQHVEQPEVKPSASTQLWKQPGPVKPGRSVSSSRAHVNTRSRQLT